MLRFDFQPMGDLICLSHVLGAAIFLLSKRALSFNNVMITLTSARWSAHIVELASVFSVHLLSLFLNVTVFLFSVVLVHTYLYLNNLI